MGSKAQTCPSLRLLQGEAHSDPAEFADHVSAGLRGAQKELSCRWIYDAEGSRLFEQICGLEEYYPTRAEEEILRERAGEIVEGMAPGTALVELGSGSSTKTQHLLRELLARDGQLLYAPIDISRAILQESAQQLMTDFEGLSVLGIAAEYREGLALLRDELVGPRYVLWLGSNVGNFDRASAVAFLRGVREDLGSEDRFLMGVDLRKERKVLERAYDDAAGVTERFNKNILTRINRELGGDFDPQAFEYRAVYDEVEGRVAMSLVSRVAQRVRIDGLDLEVAFEEGEAIHTENSHKYSLAEVDALAAAAGFEVEARWLDRAERFSFQRLRPLE